MYSVAGIITSDPRSTDSGGISLNTITPNTQENNNSKYLYGATADACTYWNAFRMKYNIAFPPMPSSNNISASCAVGVTKALEAGMNANKAVNNAE